MRTKHPELGMCGFLEYYKKKKHKHSELGFCGL